MANMTCPNCARQLRSGCIGWTEPPTDCPGYTTDPERVIADLRACVEYHDSRKRRANGTKIRSFLERYARLKGVPA